MAAQTSHGGTVPSAEVPGPDWLIDIINKEQERLTEKTEKQADGQQTGPSRPMTQIQKADAELRRLNCKCFDPLVVSLGPFHHGKHVLMEPSKEVSAVWFISLATGKPAKEVTGIESNVYQKFVEKATSMLLNLEVTSPRDCYAGNFDVEYDEADLMRMMFLDGCFILHFIHLAVKEGSDDLSNSSHHLNPKRIARDMFLLENQIPYPILSALMSLVTDEENNPRLWIMEFIFMVFLPPFEFNFSVLGCWRVPFVIFEFFFSRTRDSILLGIWHGLYDEGSEPVHLLDLLRAVLVGDASPNSSHGSGGASPNSSHGSGYWNCCFRPITEPKATSIHWNYYFRPITELKATGIHVSRGDFWWLKDVEFKRRPINSHLMLPQLVVDDSTETRLLNLLAYEKCPDGPLNRTVTSYVCFIDSLIQNTEDVKELQCEKILLNRLGSNEKVDKLFKKLATNLSPDYKVYTDVLDGIGDHYRRHFDREKVQIGQWMSQFIRTYFTTPWSIISLIAAILLLVLTLLQTIYTMLGFYET